MSGSSDRGPVNLWRRWTEPAGVPFHRFCQFLPRPGRDDDASTKSECGEAPDIRILRGPVRTALRYSPLLVLVIGVAFVVVGEFSESIVGLSTTLAPLDPAVNPLLVVALVVWLLALILPLSRVDLVPVRRLAGAVGFYGILAVLLVGTVLSVLLTASPESVPMLEPPDPELPRTVLAGSGTLLVMFLGGTLVYDAMLRLENTFSRLPAKTPEVLDSPSTEEDSIDYTTFLEEFGQALEARLDLPWIGGERVKPRVAYVFAAVFLVPFVGSRLVQFQGSGLGPIDVLTALMPTFLNVFLVVVFFQFLVLLAYFHRLLIEHGPDATDDPSRFSLRYVPGHPDGYAGFRDLGRFATRVNTLLLIAGFYLAFRFHVLGLPALEALGPNPSSGALLNWGLLFGGPLVAYLLATVAWLYLSFWQLHQVMVRGREERLYDALTDATPFDVRDVRIGPVWPVNSGLLLSMVSIDAMPLLTLLPLL